MVNPKKEATSETSLSSSNIFGTMPPFDRNNDIWKVYKGRLVAFFTTVGISDEHKKSAMLSYIGSATYTLLYNLCSPAEPTVKSFDELCAIMEEHFTPPVIIYKERQEFFATMRNDGESVLDWLVRLRAKAATCKFGNRLDALLVDKFITGQSGRVFKRLCEEDDVTLKKATEIAIRYESSSTIASSDETVLYVKSNKHSNNKFNNSSQKQQQQHNKCNHCGYTTHHKDQCRYRRAVCNSCKKTGHLASVCRSSSKVNFVDNFPPHKNLSAHHSTFSKSLPTKQDNKNLNLNYSESIFNVNSNFRHDRPIEVDIKIDQRYHTFQVDSGAAITAVSVRYFHKFFKRHNLLTDESILRGYGGEVVRVAGAFCPLIEYNGISKPFKVIVVEDGGPPILGRNFLRQFHVKTLQIANVSFDRNLSSLVNQFSNIFEEKLGCLNDIKVHLDIDESAKPIFCKPRPIPFAFKDKIEAMITDFVQSGMLTKIDNATWGTPLVPILKSDGTIRICADYKTTINKYLKEVHYPLPLISDIFAKLGGNKYFTKLDLKFAYNQILLDKEASKLVAWSTPFGVYAMNRLPFGIKPATSIFQREIEKLLIGLPGVMNYLDDIIVATQNLNDHYKLLKHVFLRLSKAGLKLNREKCLFAQTEVQYLGHRISAEGLCKLNTHIDAIVKAPTPKKRH